MAPTCGGRRCALEDLRHPSELEQPPYRTWILDDREINAVLLKSLVTSKKQTEAGGVDERDSSQVENYRSPIRGERVFEFGLERVDGRQIELAHRYDENALAFGTKLDSKGRRHITQSEWTPWTKALPTPTADLRHHARDLRQRARTIPRIPHGATSPAAGSARTAASAALRDRPGAAGVRAVGAPATLPPVGS